MTRERYGKGGDSRVRRYIVLGYCCGMSEVRYGVL